MIPKFADVLLLYDTTLTFHANDIYTLLHFRFIIASTFYMQAVYFENIKLRGNIAVSIVFPLCSEFRWPMSITSVAIIIQIDV